MSVYHYQSDYIIKAVITGLKDNRRRQSAVELFKFEEVIF